MPAEMPSGVLTAVFVFASEPPYDALSNCLHRLAIGRVFIGANHGVFGHAIAQRIADVLLASHC